MTTPLDVDPTRTYQDAYVLLVDLCERHVDLSDEAHLCVMEAFNEFADIDQGLPACLPDIDYGPVGEVLRQVRRLLTDLIATSKELQTALAFIRVDASIEAAIEHQP